jgi:phosphopantothenoylcysteine decarboxylase/phosphopantothenate--cysteine ligase
MSELVHKRILLGVTGGIAAYKSAELVRRLRDAGAEVRVAMTAAARSFVTPLTFQALSGHRVHTTLLDAEAEAAMGHIELARWADAVLVAPASADFMARLAHGLADDLLATLCLATAAPIVLAPAMNRQMWAAEATRNNAARLSRRGVRLLGPAAGGQACGETGPGRMLEPHELVRGLAELWGPRPLAGRRAVVTAGPTREALDPVRYLSNRSSGKMGYAVAAAAAAAGAEVVLVSGPVALAPPPDVRRVAVTSAAEMLEAVLAEVAGADLFIATAAVADYRPAASADRKMKKDSERMELVLERNPDILAAVAALPQRPFCVGFAAETDDVIGYARGKLEAKGLDLIAANAVGEGRGFDRDDNTLTVLWPGGERALGTGSKHDLARALMDIICERLHARD